MNFSIDEPVSFFLALVQVRGSQILVCIKSHEELVKIQIDVLQLKGGLF